MTEHLELGKFSKEDPIQCRTFIWKIPNNFPFPGDEDFALASPAFNLANAKWCLRIYVNQKLEQDGVRPIKLARLESRHPTHKIKLFCGILSHEDQEPCAEFNEYFTFDDTNTEWGNDLGLSPQEPLRKEEIVVVEDGHIAIKCEIQVNDVPQTETSTQSEEQKE